MNRWCRSWNSGGSCTERKIETEDRDWRRKTMVKHVILWTLKDELSDEEKKKVKIS